MGRKRQGVCFTLPSLSPVPLTRKAVSDFSASRYAQEAGAREIAAKIVEDVQLRGFEAVREYSRLLDGFELTPENALASRQEIADAGKSLAPAQREAMLEMKGRVEAFALMQESRMGDVSLVGKEGRTELRFVPVKRVGIYVPAGRAPLFSSLIMAAVPAAVAGAGEIVAFTPPQKDGNASPFVLAAAGMCGISRVYKIGGAQAIAAMAFGIEGVMERADVICGPGNAYVSAAKQMVAGMGARIDVPAGPSEVLVVADGSANPAFAAADMLAQAEHGADSVAWCICDSWETARNVSAELSAQLERLPEGSPARASIQKWGKVLVAKSLEEAVDASNELAPEHLELLVGNAAWLLPLVKNAGAVFVGTGEAFCDYGMSGGNHILPTNSAARAWGGVSVQTFGKWMYVERLEKAAQKRLAGTAALLARMEGLEAHARAAEARENGGEYEKLD
ncbi:MAG: histidinol dehydrogenase [Candidatus Micrarchaeota archaeon]|nr:histidinol dehydrogenase [Candidatus Micrarchaeota archaeon]